MRKFTMDNRKVIAPNSSLLCGRGRILKAGMMFVYDNGGRLMLARSLGRIATCDSDGEDCTGHVVAIVLSTDATFAFVRWVNPADITEIVGEPSHKLAAFFFAPQMSYDSQTMLRLIDYGTVCERYIDKAPAKAKEWNESAA